MNLEKKLKRIAEVCGWRFDGDFAYGPKGEYVGQLGFAFETWGELLPDYFSDLNAMHKAEKLLDSAPDRFDQWDRYWEQLETVTGCRTFDKDLNSDCRDMTHPTAAQRAEAFLRTFNLWDEPNS